MKQNCSSDQNFIKYEYTVSREKSILSINTFDY